MRLPVPLESEVLRLRLEAEERSWGARLGELEGRLRKFEEEERPAFERWLRLEFGPQLYGLEELHERIRERRIIVRRVEWLVETQGLHPREALHVALGHGEEENSAHEAPSHSEGDENAEEVENSSRESGKAPKNWDADEIEARRRAKREAKREARRERKRDQAGAKAAEMGETGAAGGDEPGGRAKPLMNLYRSLARKLHPDSPDAMGGERAKSLWLKVQEAYQAKSVERLMALWLWLGGTPGSESGKPEKLSFSERYDRIRQLRKALGRLEKKLAGLAEGPAWGFGGAEGLPRKKLRSRVRRDIDDDTARAQEWSEALDDFIASIGPPREPRTVHRKKSR